jgi:hypothetical protein
MEGADWMKRKVSADIDKNIFQKEGGDYSIYKPL